MPIGLLFVFLIGSPADATQTAPAQLTCDDLLGRWQYISPPSPLPGVVDIWREATGKYVGQWRRIPPRQDEASSGTWVVPRCEPMARWLILFGTRPAPSCMGHLRERATGKTIEWFCHMPDGTASLTGAAQRPS
jgi:hypothetical protein